MTLISPPAILREMVFAHVHTFLKQVASNILFCALILSGCAKSDRILFDQSQSLINQRKYQEAVTLLEKESANRNSPELKAQLGYAYLGLSGIELLEVASHVSFLKSFKSINLDTNELSKTCPQVPSGISEYAHLPCLPTIKIEGFPDPENPHLKKALSILEETFPRAEATNQDMNLLMAVVYLGMATQNYNLLVNQKTDNSGNEDYFYKRELHVQTVSKSVRYFKRTLKTFASGIHRLFFSYGKVKRFLDKFNGKPLLKIGPYTYYGSPQVSADDFFQFVMASAEMEANYQFQNATRRKENIQDFSHALTRALSFVNLKIKSGKEAFLGAYYLRILSLGSQLIPDRMVYHESLQQPFAFISTDKPLPKALLRFVESIKKTWDSEDGEFLLTEIDDVHTQYDRYERMTKQWDHFWKNLDEPTQAEFRYEAETFKDRIPQVEINPEQKIDYPELKIWYESSTSELTQFAQRMILTHPDKKEFQALPNLIDQSKEWINYNLW